MKYSKILYSLAIALAGLLVTLLWIQQSDLVNLICLIGAFALLSYHRPLLGLFIILFLPTLGEFSRFELIGRSIVISDLLIPLFITSFLLQPKLPALPEKMHTPIKALLIFLGIAAFSLLLSLIDLPVSAVLSSSLYLVRLVEYMALFPIAVLLFKNQSDLHKTIKWIGLITLLIAATGFIQLELLPSLEQLAKTAGYDPHINRLVGSWLDPNFIGGFFAFMICIFTGILLYQKNNRYRLLNIIFLAIISIALFTTYSRSAYVALAAGILVLGLLKSRQLMIAVIIIGCLGVTFSDRAQQRVGELVTSINSVLFNTSENPDPTARLRIKNWEDTLTLISEKPLFGHGYNTLSYTKTDQGFVADEEVHSASGSDSSLLTILATTGFAGLFFYIIFLGHTLFTAFRKWRQSTSPNQKGLYLGILSALVGLFIHSNFVNSLLFPQIMIFFFISLGLLYAEPNN